MIVRKILNRVVLVACASLITACPPEKKDESAAAEDPDASQASGEGQGDGGASEELDAEVPDDEEPTEERDGGSTGACLANNGALETMNGSLVATITNTDANLTVPVPGTIPCEAKFEAAGGVGLGGGMSTGQMMLTCWGAKDALYFGLEVYAFGKWDAGKVYPFGSPGSVASGAGYVSNGEASLTYEEGPRCDSKQNKSAAWDAQRDVGGELRIDKVEGQVVTFTIHEASLAPGNNSNYVGSGAFKLSGTGTVTPASI